MELKETKFGLAAYLERIAERLADTNSYPKAVDATKQAQAVIEEMTQAEYEAIVKRIVED